MKKRMKQTPPTAIGAMTSDEVHGYDDPPQAVPRMTRPTPKMNRMVPKISSVASAGRMDVSRDPVRKWVPSMSSLRRRTYTRI